MTSASIKNWVARYGSGVIRQGCGNVDDYVVVSSPSAWRATQEEFAHAPRAVAFADSQEEVYLKQLACRLPKTSVVLGIGGGVALDAAKFVAWRHQARLILVPTVVSSGAVFQQSVPSRRNGKLYLIPHTVVPECVLFDTDVIRAAPPHLNAAGMAECIWWLGGVASWKWWCSRGLDAPPWDQAVADEVEEWVRERVAGFVADLDATGRPGAQAVRICAEVNRERYDLRLAQMNALHALDHLFENTFTWVLGRRLLHGEGVALGTLINCHLYGSHFALARSMLEACGTRYRPDQIGCTWPEVQRTLPAIPAHGEHLGWPQTILHHQSVDPPMLREMARRIEGDVGAEKAGPEASAFVSRRGQPAPQPKTEHVE